MSESEQGRWSSIDDAGLLAVITEQTPAQAVAAAAQLDAIAELGDRYDIANPDGEPAEHRFWAVDTYEQVVLEVAAAAALTQKAAAKLVSTAVALRRRLPKVAALLRRGDISVSLASTITFRTFNVTDDAILLVDTALADAVTTWGPMSQERIEASIDMWVNHFDPEAVRVTKQRARARCFQLGSRDDVAGVTGVWGALLSADAAIVDKCLTQMATEVCRDDPRTMRQRMADALGALARRHDRLACECGSANCPVAGKPAKGNVVIHILGDAALLDAAVDPEFSGVADDPAWMHAEQPQDPTAPPTTRDELRESTPQSEAEPNPKAEAKEAPSAQSQPQAPAFILGRGFIPPSHVADLIRKGATVRPLRPAEKLLVPDTTYRPSRALADRIRMRDLWCRFPNCAVAADRCDLDHTEPWPRGHTHPSNLKCLCRLHHLAKTHCGWLDQQLPDGTVTWTSPAGQTYTTHPGSRLLFPGVTADTGPLPPSLRKATSSNQTGAASKMPLRKRTRAQVRAARIAAERARRQRLIDENAPPF